MPSSICSGERLEFLPLPYRKAITPRGGGMALMKANASVHRGSLVSARIRLSIFDSRIEISPPGRLPDNRTVGKFGAAALPRPRFRHQGRPRCLAQAMPFLALIHCSFHNTLKKPVGLHPLQEEAFHHVSGDAIDACPLGLLALPLYCLRIAALIQTAIRLVRIQTTTLGDFSENAPQPDILRFLPIRLEYGHVKPIEFSLFFCVFGNLERRSRARYVRGPFQFQAQCIRMRNAMGREPVDFARLRSPWNAFGRQPRS